MQNVHVMRSVLPLTILFVVVECFERRFIRSMNPTKDYFNLQLFTVQSKITNISNNLLCISLLVFCGKHHCLWLTQEFTAFDIF